MIAKGPKAPLRLNCSSFFAASYSFTARFGLSHAHAVAPKGEPRAELLRIFWHESGTRTRTLPGPFASVSKHSVSWRRRVRLIRTSATQICATPQLNLSMDGSGLAAPISFRGNKKKSEKHMKLRMTLWVALAIAFAIPGICQSNSAGKSTSISGWVIDSSCAYTKGLEKPISGSCAKACAKNGSPLVILRDDGAIYLPIDSKTPSSSQNAKLLPFAGEHVKVSGTEYAHGDSHGIVIASIAPDRR